MHNQGRIMPTELESLCEEFVGKEVEVLEFQSGHEGHTIKNINLNDEIVKNLTEKAKKQGFDTIRYKIPGRAYTMEYIQDRLSVSITLVKNEKYKITAFSIG